MIRAVTQSAFTVNSLGFLINGNDLLFANERVIVDYLIIVH